MDDMYEARNSIYCYPNSNVLKNKLKIANFKELMDYEAKITAAKLFGLRKQKITGNFDSKHFIEIHRYLFEDIYPFAGLFRAENIAKDNFRFAEWQYITTEIERIMNSLANEKYLDGLSKRELASRLSYYMAELNVLHPFRDRQWQNYQRIYETISFEKWILL